MSQTDSSRVAGWLALFDESLKSGDVKAAANLFTPRGHWRDLLAFTWNIITLEGRSAIADMLARQLQHVGPHSWHIEADEGDLGWLTFETDLVRGRAIVRLQEGKCTTLLTVLTQLKGFEEQRGATRPLGLRHGATGIQPTWAERRDAERAALGQREQPSCLIVGGGQGGIALGARLRQLNVPTIVIDKNARPGDSWRNRYRSLVLHDPVWYDHMPYIPFPDHWPVFAPKDQMGDWLEMYAKVMDLNYWGRTRCHGARYDAAAGRWHVDIERDGERVNLQPRFLVLATGAYGSPRMIEIAGSDQFAGPHIHTASYQSGADYAGMKCVVIGSGSSGHDVAADLCAAGAQVTMVQRSPTIVVRSETLMALAFGQLYSQEAVEGGMTTEKADLLAASVPLRRMADVQRPIYQAIAQQDAEFYTALNAAGFQTDFGEDGSGLMMKALRTASGYYIDVGASSLVIEGQIKVKSGVEITHLSAGRMHFSDESSVPADAIIQATGYGTPNETIARLISPQVAGKVGRFWGYGSSTRGDPGPWVGELRNMWGPLAQDNLWFHGGNLALSRFYSAHVALQIKARQEGLPTPVYLTRL